MPRRSTRPHVCCRCGAQAGHVLCFSIEGQVVAHLWLCTRHKAAALAGAWGMSVEERPAPRGPIG